MEHLEVLSSQRESPLKPEQGEKQASQQRIADVIHEMKLLHGPDAFAVTLYSGDARQQRANVSSYLGQARHATAIIGTLCSFPGQNVL